MRRSCSNFAFVGANCSAARLLRHSWVHFTVETFGLIPLGAIMDDATLNILV